MTRRDSKPTRLTCAQRSIDPSLNFGAGQLLHFQTKRDVLPDRFMREESIVLEHQPEMALVYRDMSDIFTIPEDLALLSALQTGDNTQQR